MRLGIKAQLSVIEIDQMRSGRVWCLACGVRSVVRVCASSLVLFRSARSLGLNRAC